MSVENTLNRFKLISGLESGEAEQWQDLVSEAREYIDSLVIKDDIFELDEKRLDNAAAVYAYYRYLCYSSSDESSFSAGDIKVTFNNDKLKAAKEMWDMELENIKDIADTGKSLFIFKRVN